MTEVKKQRREEEPCYGHKIDIDLNGASRTTNGTQQKENKILLVSLFKKASGS